MALLSPPMPWHDVGLGAATEAFPFVTELSLRPLVDFWRQSMAGNTAVLAQIDAALQQCPALLEPITDLAMLAPHQALLDLLMQAIVAPAIKEDVAIAALWPYHLGSFYATPTFTRLLLDEQGWVRGRSNVDETLRAQARLTYAYVVILWRLYNIVVDFDYPLIFTGTDPATGLDCHFKVRWNPRFIEVDTIGEVPPLTESLRRDVLANLGNLPALMRLLPPEQFRLRGFLLLHALEVTDQEVLSSLKRDLIDRDTLISTERFHSLQAKLRTLFRQPDLCFSVAACQGPQLLMLHAETQIAYGCIYADSVHYTPVELEGSVYARVLRHGERGLIEDLEAHTPRAPIEDSFLRRGARNLVVAPLVYQDKIIGALALLSPRPGALHALNTAKLHEVLPLFAMAVQRSMDELNTRIQAVIKEQCTAIHPAVEWRFRQAAGRWIERRQHGDLSEMEPIVFEDVCPFYGVSDIRASSTHRSAAIQADLIAQLELVRDLLQRGYAHEPLPLLTALSFHVGKHIARLEVGLGASDETTVLDFLQRDVEPVLAYLETSGAAVRDQLARYRQSVHPRLGTFSQQRRAFEDSVMQLNETLAAYLDHEEHRAQTMIPHYFEQHKSDGIEFGLYVGASLLERPGFDMVHVHNLRLWQLLVTCGLARQAAHIKSRLHVPLEVAHLILVQDTPMSIRFRFDEKRFDIDGAYNMRYEIIKKRIDKAFIKGTQERLTQPGKIAIVYAQPREALEYRDYLEYLQAAGELTEDIEMLELEDLPGAQGLHALRVTVALDAAPSLRPPTEEVLQSAVLRNHAHV